MRFQDHDYFYEYMVLEISDIYIIYLNIKDYSLYMGGMFLNTHLDVWEAWIFV